MSLGEVTQSAHLPYRSAKGPQTSAVNPTVNMYTATVAAICDQERGQMRVNPRQGLTHGVNKHPADLGARRRQPL